MDIFFTSDTHSYLYPTSFSSRDVVNAGLQRIIASIRRHPESQGAIFIDGGDSLLGSPLSKYVFENNLTTWPQAKAFKEAGLSFMTVGNHDFDYGHDELHRFLKQTGATALCANIIDKKGEIDFKDHIVITSDDGLRIGFTGLITEYTADLEPASVMKDFVLEDAFEVAKRELAWLKENADVCVLVYHGGFECNLDTGEIMPGAKGNCGYRIATELDYDLILSAHQHMEVPFRKLGNSYTLQCLPNGAQYAKLSIKKVNGKVQITGQLKKPDPMTEPYTEDPLLQKVQTWLDTPAGTIKEAVEGTEHLEAFLHGSHIADFFNTVQLDASCADISATALPNQVCFFDKSITLRQVLSAYPYSNTMVVLEVGEAELRAALEGCASFFEMTESGVAISKAFTEPFPQYFNFDFYLGLDYTFDLSRPVGSRVVKLLYKGREIGERRLKLVLNNFRASGSGLYQVFKTCPVIREIPDNIQDKAVEYLLKYNDNLSWEYGEYSTIGY